MDSVISDNIYAIATVSLITLILNILTLYTTLTMQRTNYRPSPTSPMLLASLLSNLQQKRKSYCLQLLKQFILFPDDTESSQKTVSKYDSLIFSDEQLHTMFKKLQTKLLQRQMWAFLNLKYHRYVKAISMMQQPIKILEQQKNKENKQFSFVQIKVFSETKTKHLQMQNRTEVSMGSYNPPPKVAQNGGHQGERYEINIDIEHKTTFRTVGSYSPHHHQGNSYSRGKSRQRPRIQQPAAPSYPISQIHPLQPARQSVERVEAPVVTRSYRLLRDQDQDQRRSRSRSGSITRYEYEQDGSRKIIIRSDNYPSNIRVVRSQSPLDEPPHRTIRTPPKQVRYEPLTRIQREELVKRQNLRLEYNNNQVSGMQQKQRASPYTVRRVLVTDNSPACPSCHKKHPSTICPARSSSRKITRLRSSSKKKDNEYLQHLQA